MIGSSVGRNQRWRSGLSSRGAGDGGARYRSSPDSKDAPGADGARRTATFATGPRLRSRAEVADASDPAGRLRLVEVGPEADPGVRSVAERLGGRLAATAKP